MSKEGKATTSAQSSFEEAKQSRRLAAERSAGELRAVFTERMILIGAVLATFTVGFYVLLYFQTRSWQILANAGCLVLSILCLIPARRLVRRRKLDAAGYWILGAVVTAFGGGELLWAGATVCLTLSALLLMGIVGSMIRPRRWRIWLVVGSLWVIYVLLVNRFEPLPRYDVTPSPVLRIYTPGVLALLVLAALWQSIRAYQRLGSIRLRFLIAVVSLVLLLAAVVGAGAAVVGFQSAQGQVINQLESVTTLKEAEINSWLHNLQTDLAIALAGEDAIQYARVLLQESPDSAEYQDTYGKLAELFGQFKQTKEFDELFLMNHFGVAILSTDATQEHRMHSHQPYFQEEWEGKGRGYYVQPPSLSLARITVIVARPVVGPEGHTVGVLAGRASLIALNEIMLERAGLGETGETYLVSADHILLSGLRFDTREEEFGTYMRFVRTEGVKAALESQTNGSGLYDNYQGRSVLGVYHWLPALQVVLVAEQEQAEALRSIYVMLRIIGGVALAAVVAAVIASLLVTRSIATPLAELAATAAQIAAGDLERVAKVEREDEVGALAQAFNSMTAQLRGLISSLEQRVADRTRELERRSAYMEASAEVGRAATSILETDRLIRQAVELIRERFGLYYVGLFLVDEAGEWAVLQAGTGEAGRAMLARGHRVRVGEGMIGWSIAKAQARIALEAGEDAVRLATAELPATRSEAALPLRSRGQVLGALTIQSDQSGAFDQETLVVLQTMADQVAVALDNAHLFAESQAALEATRRAYGELSREAWAELLRVQPDLAYRSDESGVTSAGDIWRPEMERALQEGQTVQIPNPKSQIPNPLAVPIKVHGNVIGVLDTYKPSNAGEWTPEEVALLETLADQLGMALESARLYQDTQRRAAREQLTREITDKMRRATGVEDIVQTAVDELCKVLGTSRTFVRLGVAPPLRTEPFDPSTESILSKAEGLRTGSAQSDK